MTIQHLTKVLDVEGFASSTERYVCLEIAARADRKGVLRMPQAELAEVTKLSLATIKRVFRALEAALVLERIGHGRYLLCIDDIEEDLTTRGTALQMKPGALEEQARLQRIRAPHQAIRWTADGWPVLEDR